MYKNIGERLAARTGKTFAGKWTRGLPFGLKLANGTVVGQDAQ
jgi:salicylate hydroxylase